MNKEELLKILKKDLENTFHYEEDFIWNVNDYLRNYELNMVIDDPFCLIIDELDNKIFGVEVENCDDGDIRIIKVFIIG